MRFLTQLLVLIQKDLLLVLRRQWFTTFVRALLFPVILTFILSDIGHWILGNDHNGIGSSSPVLDFASALKITGKTRPRVVVIDNGFNAGDVGEVIGRLSDAVKDAGKDLHVVRDTSSLISICPSSNAGVSECYGAVEFLSSPGHGPSDTWNYTIYGDEALGKGVSVTPEHNDVQLYILPFQRAIDSAIIATGEGRPLPAVYQYPFTAESEDQRRKNAFEKFMSIVQTYLPFVYFIAICGIVFHLTGHVATEREEGLLQLIDAMMPNRHRWQCQAIRITATHLAFDVIYMPGFILSGVMISVLAFPGVNTGYLVLFYILTGLALTSFSLLASSLFKRSQLSGIISVIIAIVLAVAGQFGVALASPTTSLVLATSTLFPPMLFVYFIITVAENEADGLSLQLSSASTDEDSWHVPLSIFLGLLCAQIFVFPLVAAVIERALHIKTSQARTVLDHGQTGGRAIRLKGLSRTFKTRSKRKPNVKAVDNLDLDVVTGSITVMLGANGSGKSTTLNSIAGIDSITAGSITIESTNGLGYCPQQNVLWDLMTVEEHIKFFARLKCPEFKGPERTSEVKRLVAGCDLEMKRTAQAKTLSGGQMRKLQLAVMLAGGSSVCIVDEASSGIDPLARRKLWDILLKERGNRTILMTTHFLDEAEVLSDHVAILSKGVLKAQGSVANLKSTLGGPYRIYLSGDDAQRVPDLPNVEKRYDFNKTILELPETTVIATTLESLQRSGLNYRIQGPRLEDVFLRLSEEMQGNDDLARDLGLSVTHGSEVGRSGDERVYTSPFTKEPHVMSLDSGMEISLMQQTFSLLRKRLVVLQHNYMPYICALAIPLLVAGLVPRMLTQPSYISGLPCDTRTNANALQSDRLVSYYLEGSGFVYGPSNRIPPTVFERLKMNFTDDVSSSDSIEPVATTTVESLTAFKDYIAAHTTDLYLGGFFYDTVEPTFAWSSTSYSGPKYQVFLQNIVNMLISGEVIYTRYGNFVSASTIPNGDTILVAGLTTLGFTIYPGLFALYPTAERTRKVRAMHYSNGISSIPLWSAYAAFDGLFIVIISILATVVWSQVWHDWYALPYVFVIFLLFGLASTAFSYVVSLFAPSQLAAIAMSTVVQFILSMLFLVAYSLAWINAPVTSVYAWFNYCYYTMGLISPAIHLLRALMMTLNMFALICRGHEKASYPGEFSIFGAPILYLILQFLGSTLFLMYWESGKSLEIFGIRNRARDTGVSEKPSCSPDVTEDASHLEASNDGLRVRHVSKNFGSNLAVDDVTFGVTKSERFALLGPNGAGKSTMISLMRGELKPSSASCTIHIANDSMTANPVAAKTHLGVCPQFDAVDSMTLTQHLRFYAQARGVPNPEHNVNELLTRLDLHPHAHKLAKKLSGGTKRKLSLAIALIANPSVLLLDEPSSGMDPAAKRALWSTLAQVSAGRAMLMTTHSMEEAGALCDRAGIMAGRLLALGMVDELCRRYGSRLHVHLAHRDAPHTDPASMDALREWVESYIPDAEIESRTFYGQLRFSVPRGEGHEGQDVGKLFRLIESNKSALRVEHFSISPSTLDQVFLEVVGRHDVEEENAGSGNSGKDALWRRLLGRK